MKTFIVIPAYNEGSVIKETIEGVLPYCSNIIVVDDGSTDDTELYAKASEVIVLRHIVNRGQGAALRSGINYALRKGADIIVTFDADGQFDPKEIDDLVKKIENGEVDIVLGSRFKGQNNASFLKKLILFLGTLFTKVITGLKITDTHNGFRAMTRSAAKKITIRQDRMAHSSEILHEISKLRLKYMEMPVTVKYTDYSKYKGQKFSGAFKILFDLILK